jgi:hypothetical protein
MNPREFGGLVLLADSLQTRLHAAEMQELQFSAARLERLSIHYLVNLSQEGLWLAPAEGPVRLAQGGSREHRGRVLEHSNVDQGEVQQVMGKEVGLAVSAEEALETLEESESCREGKIKGEDA